MHNIRKTQITKKEISITKEYLQEYLSSGVTNKSIYTLDTCKSLQMWEQSKMASFTQNLIFLFLLVLNIPRDQWFQHLQEGLEHQANPVKKPSLNVWEKEATKMYEMFGEE